MPKLNFSHIKRRKLSGYRGVDWHKNGWITQIKVDKKMHKFGPFKSELEAAKTYDKKALEFFKDKAILNIFKSPFPPKSVKMKIKRKINKRKLDTNKIQKRVKFSVIVRNKICARQKWCCNICNCLLSDIFIVDHIIPLFIGGSNSEYNLQALCPSCDRFKTSDLDYKYIRPLSQMKKVTVDDVFQIQRENLHRTLCIDPTSIPSTVNNMGTINCQQYFNNIQGSLNQNSGISMNQSEKELELNINGIKVKIQI